MKTLTIEIPDDKELVKEGDVYKLVDIKPITERVKTFEDALDILGEDNELVRGFNYFKEHMDFMTRDMMAYIKLKIVVAALNEGWTPSFNEYEYRWYPCFVLYTNQEIADMQEENKKEAILWYGGSSNLSVSGFAFGDSKRSFLSSYSHIGHFLMLKSYELANYVGKQFIELYKVFIMG